MKYFSILLVCRYSAPRLISSELSFPNFIRGITGRLLFLFSSLNYYIYSVNALFSSLIYLFYFTSFLICQSLSLISLYYFLNLLAWVTNCDSSNIISFFSLLNFAAVSRASPKSRSSKGCIDRTDLGLQGYGICILGVEYHESLDSKLGDKDPRFFF